MRITFPELAPGAFSELSPQDGRFTQPFLDQRIGNVVPIDLNPYAMGQSKPVPGRIVSAIASDDGKSARVEVDVDAPEPALPATSSSRTTCSDDS